MCVGGGGFKSQRHTWSHERLQMHTGEHNSIASIAAVYELDTIQLLNMVGSYSVSKAGQYNYPASENCWPFNCTAPATKTPM